MGGVLKSNWCCEPGKLKSTVWFCVSYRIIFFLFFINESLITGMEYGIQWWNGKCNGKINIPNCSLRSFKWSNISLLNESLFQQHPLMRLHISFITLAIPKFYLGRRPGNIKITSRTGKDGLSKSPCISARYYPVQSAMMFVLTAMDFKGVKLLTILARL